MRDDPTQNDNPYVNEHPFGVPNNNIQSTATDQNIASSVARQVQEEQVIVPKETPKKETPRRVIELPDEPAEDNADATKIVLRMPASGERI